MKFFEHLEGLVAGQLAIIKTLVDLVRLETRLAGLSIYPLLITACCLLIVLMTAWSLSMILLGYVLMAALGHVVWTVLLLWFINLGLIFFLLYYLLFNFKKMSFEKTRQYLFKREDHDYANLEKQTD